VSEVVLLELVMFVVFFFGYSLFVGPMMPSRKVIFFTGGQRRPEEARGARGGQRRPEEARGGLRRS
jgi:hypothetical protein